MFPFHSLDKRFQSFSVSFILQLKDCEQIPFGKDLCVRITAGNKLGAGETGKNGVSAL